MPSTPSVEVKIGAHVEVGPVRQDGVVEAGEGQALVIQSKVVAEELEIAVGVCVHVVEWLSIEADWEGEGYGGQAVIALGARHQISAGHQGSTVD